MRLAIIFIIKTFLKGKISLCVGVCVHVCVFTLNCRWKIAGSGDFLELLSTPFSVVA